MCRAYGWLPREAERALARFGLLEEGAAPVFAAGARYPLAGLLLALPARAPAVLPGPVSRGHRAGFDLLTWHKKDSGSGLPECPPGSSPGAGAESWTCGRSPAASPSRPVPRGQARRGIRVIML